MPSNMALEKKIDLLVDKVDGLSNRFDGLSTKVDGLSTNFDGLSTKVDGLSTSFDGLSTKVDALSTHVNRLDGQVGELKEEVGGLKGEVGALTSKVAMGFEESHRLMKLSLEGLGALEETTIAHFDKMTGEHAKQFDLLEKFGVHVRRRVERLEGPVPRRRR